MSVCADYCERHRYDIVSVATSWHDVVTLLRRDEAQVAVVARRDHLPPERESRLEVVAEAQTAPAAPSDRSQRRPRRVSGER